MKGADQCPRCGSRRIADLQNPIAGFYATVLRMCCNPACRDSNGIRTTWEPFDPAQLRDPRHEPLGAFIQPCDNCAFRKGSPEQADSIEWGKKLYALRQGAAFHCHKGVPIEPGSEHGFAYPEGGTNPRKLRLCRGYLNAIVRNRFRAAALDAQHQPDEPQPDEPHPHQGQQLGLFFTKPARPETSRSPARPEPVEGRSHAQDKCA